jgi:hypothetical protein
MFPFLATLGWYWLIAPVVVAVAGVAMFVGGIGHILSGNGGRGTARLAVGAPLALVGSIVGLVGLNTQTFARLTYEAPVADVSIKALDPAHSTYRVTIARRDGPQLTMTCDLQGDEWEMSARVQRWRPWANVLGLDSTYTLDQIDNKYFTAERGNGKPITACDLKGPPPAVDQYVPQSWLFWLTSHSYTEERRFGSASYMPLADGATYRVIMTQAGLNAEPSNDIAQKANAARP